jgi:pSer/pThr/pTyr-binding forkhead associated (FHA) protein
VLTKELIKIGRGGSAHWVDLMLVTDAKVSREHCRIRRDPSGRFFIQDVSAWGTFLNGEPVPKYTDGAAAKATEREITDGATLRLADAVTLEFRVE